MLKVLWGMKETANLSRSRQGGLRESQCDKKVNYNTLSQSLGCSGHALFTVSGSELDASSDRTDTAEARDPAP